jgi:hypothetical protein
MPAPSVQIFKDFLTTQLLAQGIKKRSYSPSGALVESTELPDKMKLLVQAHSIALFQHWAKWQSEQTVTVQGVTSGPSTASGAPGIALP